MIDFSKLPFVRIPKEWADRFEKQVWDDCVRDGREAYRAGLP